MTTRPASWVKYAPVAALPLLAAWALGTNSMQKELLGGASVSLKAAGADWAKVTLDGRDARISGDSLTQGAIDAAVKAVAGTYGIRRVESIATVLPLVPPAVNSLQTEAPPLVVTGTWQEGIAKGLRAALLGETWEFGKSKELTSDGKGNWTLTFPMIPEPGTYDIVVEVLDDQGKATVDTSKDEIVVLPKLTAPTVVSVLTNKNPPQITGTWPSAIATALSVAVGATKYVMGQAKELTVTGDNWVLTPAAPLPQGTVDVTVEVTDKFGRASRSAEPGKITVDTEAPAAPVIDPINIAGSAISAAGSWDEEGATSLVARLAGQTWVYRADPALTSDGNGRWSFKPEIDLAPGTYDLEIEIRDNAGNVARDATRDEIVIREPAPPPPLMLAPTVAAAEELVARPVVKGTWSELAAKSLTVTLAGRTYTFGTGEALKSDAVGNWSLVPERPLADGTYDVAVETIDMGGKRFTDSTSNELTVDAAGPATPQVKLYSGAASPGAISGEWDAAAAERLSVTVPAAGLAATLGTDAALTARAGQWTLALAAPLPPGNYDVVVETADARGRIARDQTKFEINIKEPPPPPEPAPEPEPKPEPAPEPEPEPQPEPVPPALPEMKNPTIESFSGAQSPESISGTWDNQVASELAVAIPAAQLSATLGADSALLVSPDGRWLLALPAKLEPGTYDVVVIQKDKEGRVATDQSTAEIIITEPAPPPPPPLPDLKRPTVATFAGEQSPEAISGTWDNVNARELSVAVPGARIAATLGADSNLIGSPDGTWLLALQTKLAPGIYDVAVTERDAAGRVAADNTTAEIYVKEPAPPPPPPPPPPYDCEGVLGKISAVFPIRFEFGTARLESPYDLAVKQYAALLADPRCLQTKALVTGHADYYGGRLYNRALSLARAQSVVDALAEAGVSPARLATVGKGKSAPLDSEKKREARAKNRRVEITLEK